MKAVFRPREFTIPSSSSQNGAPATRERILEVACILFAEAGFHGTHLREVCKRAGANVAGACYHFRSKEGLYQAVILEAARQLSTQDNQVQDLLLDAPPEQRLQVMVGSLFEKLGGDHVWIAKLLARELLAPVCGKEVFAGSGLGRDLVLLQGVIGKLLGTEVDGEVIRLHTLSVVSECLFYSIAGDKLHQALPEVVRRLPNRASLARHVTGRCLGAMDWERRDLAKSTS